MKRRFMAILLVGGLTLGLWGCGGSSDSALPDPATEAQITGSAAYSTEEVLPEVWYTADDLLEMWDAGTLSKEKVVEMAEAGEMNDATFEEMMDFIAREEEYAARIEMIRASDKGWSVDDLIDLYYTGALSKEEITEMVATEEISSETFEEFLARIEWNGKPTVQSGKNLNGESPAEDIVAELLAEYAIEFEDFDGYRIRETIQLSPIFTEDDTETMHALWEALGNDVADFPSEESLYNTSHLLREMRDSHNCNELEYIIGTYTVENLTDGFSITPDNPRSYQGALSTKQVSAFDEEHDGNASHFINVRSVSMVMYSDGATYYGEGNSTILSKAKMCSNTWGPRAFVIALPNGSTPNLPDGYRYDKTLILSTGMYLTDEYDPITLKYYTKEVE